ncbi:AAA family ATPase [Aliarcobacter butzleri]|uniref:AAA family ATPase n=1 Tax=Aliarcobacter butzleri TaxID=28197 RepID=A0AAW6VS05_9BACT|nr:AAA family ATPase [Aliarcobacter butzleri]MDK2063217.1 AAA family ATPase [Aliarcobacter butzleri]MDK2071157.1 AAA family ATPase [Aliarcobacter butzleri]
MSTVLFCRWGDEQKVAERFGDCYILSSDNWDDFGYKTSFHVKIFKNNEEYGTFERKILFDNQDDIYSSSGLLESLLQNEIYLRVEGLKESHNFISLGYEYDKLIKLYPIEEEFEKILKSLNDVIYLEKKEPSNTLLSLKEHNGFTTSLCRDQSSKKLLDEAANILYGATLNENRLKFNFRFNLNSRSYDYEFNFIKSETPSRINILIGKNGSGKSQTLLSLSTYLINSRKASYRFNTEVDVHPNFISNLMVFAYNTYEEFYVNRESEKLDINYKYLGLKKITTLKDIELNSFLSEKSSFFIISYLINKYNSSLENILLQANKDNTVSSFIEEIFIELKDSKIEKDNISTAINKLIKQLTEYKLDINTPKETTFNSFKEIYIKDRNNYAHTIHLDDIPYRNKVIEFLNEAFDCTSISLKVIKNKEFYERQKFEFVNDYLQLKNEVIHQNFVKEINFDDFEQKLYFFNGFNEIFLSSGQQTFADLIINLLSLIKNNTLVLVDEPENTLHPNLEIDYIKILNDILEEFDSFAIIATHSPIIVREVPTNHINVIKINKESNEVTIANPNIGTFGGDVGTISNYVFDDILKDKKLHIEWFEKEKPRYANFEQFEEKYRNILNYDFLLYCKNNWSI